MIRAVSVEDKETAVSARFRFPDPIFQKRRNIVTRSLHYRKRDITDHWNRRLLVTTHANSSLRRHLRTIFNEGTCAGLSDGQLLEQFATKTGTDAEPAFTLLIEQHGPMVFRVCRSIPHGWFGAAFKAYGVRAIPSAAVIDRQGRIVFVGRFTEALQQAASLLEK